MIDPEWYAIIESLEIKLKPGAFSREQYLNLTWELKSYDSEFIYIQLHFEYPNKLSEETYFDTLQIFFWGTDYFKSANGERVRYGTMLDRVVVRQIDVV